MSNTELRRELKSRLVKHHQAELERQFQEETEDGPPRCDWCKPAHRTLVAQPQCPRDATWRGVWSCGCTLYYCDEHHDETLLRARMRPRFWCVVCGADPISLAYFGGLGGLDGTEADRAGVAGHQDRPEVAERITPPDPA